MCGENVKERVLLVEKEVEETIGRERLAVVRFGLD